MSTPQSWNRYSYVTNRPVNFNDPTGHIEACDKDDWACQYHWDIPIIPPKEDNDDGSEGPSVSSEVFLVFGIPGEGQNTIGYASGDGVCNSGGMGTVINNQSTIVTASHVAGSCATTQNTLWVQVNGKWISYPLVNVPISPGPGPDEGDVVTLVLPSDLPSYVIPASVAMNHHFVPGQSVDVNYYTTLLNEEGKITGFELLSSTTVAKKGWGWRVDTAYGQQIMLEKTLPGGSSGAGVFYDGQLIGVNSYADNLNYTGTSIAPFCYWLGLVC